MQKLRLNHALTHRLSPQKLQLIKLLQVPSVAMKTRIEQELARNPALEEASTHNTEAQDIHEGHTEDEAGLHTHDLDHDNYQVYHRGHAQSQRRLTAHELTFATPYSLDEQLLRQLSFLKLSKHQHKIGVHLIGSIERDGYIRRDLEAIVNDLSFTQYIDTSVQEVAAVLAKIQRLDPPGIGARNLQECLLVQLEKSTSSGAVRKLATQVLMHCFQEFTKKHYSKISEKLAIKDPLLLQEALALITSLDPKPGSSINVSSRSEVLHPDFIVTKQHGHLHVALTTYVTPTLRTSRRYVAMLERYHKHKKKDQRTREASSFVKKRLEAAQWFIDAVKQREHTLLNTMKTIVRLQHAFFIEEDERQLRPMVLKYVAQEIGMDVSTVARIVNNKSVQTDFGIYPLKFFFTKAITTTSGEEVSNRAVKKAIAEVIKSEDKQHPLADEKIASLLKAQGYPIARRTVAKYREQLHLPVARLRRAL
ncbi:MAG: RNA polymerase factor sigma-54 [Bacteroidota bacterium]